LIDIIIATYNRFEKAKILALNLLNIGGEFIHRIIIVDSTDNQHVEKFKSEKLIHFVTQHKNQPYQRYLGYKISNSKYLLFLDDDMELIDNSLFEDLIKIFKDKNVIGVNLSFKNINNFLKNQPKGFVKNKYKKIIGFITGHPIAKKNQYLFCGIRGQRVSNRYVKFLSGGAFAVRRKNMYSNFNMQLFDLYEQKLGKGEDGILGYTISLNGLIKAPPNLYFIHNDYSDSSYAINYSNYSKRVMYSRLYLACEYYRLNNKHWVRGVLRFHHYAIGRISGALINYCLNPSPIQRDIISGYIKGWVLAMKFSFDFKRNANWQLLSDLDLRNNT
tara:strand:+ start:14963 stop:15955 length:993 start_codon:yes stop_codon:yes gene_type:complete